MTRNVVTRALLVLVGAAVVLVAVISGPAQAAPSALIERDGEPVVMTINGRAVVDAGDVVDDVWIGNGTATINGRVEGSVIILNGYANVLGSVGGDVTVVRGGASVGPQAVVDGDVRVSGSVIRADGAVVAGSVDEGSVLDGLRSIVPMVRTALWVGLTIALFALGIVAVRLADRTVRDARHRLTARPLGSALRGAALLALLPLLALVSLATIVGGLLSLLLLALAALAALAGLVVVATQIGRWLLPRHSSALVLFLLGALILRIVALVPVLGAVVTILAALSGAGALLLTRQDEPDDEDDGGEHQGEAAPLPSLEAADTATGGRNLDLRSGGPGEPGTDQPTSTAGPGWLDHMEGGDRDGTPVLDARADELTIDLLGGSEPTGAPAEAPRPEVLAALPVREDNWADDPQGAPGNGIRQALFADPPRGTTADARVSAPAETGSPADAGGYQGPLFTEPDPTGSPADAAPVSADGDAHDLPLGDLSGAGGRAWRPGNN